VTHYSGGSAILKLEYGPTGVPVLAKGDVKPFGRVEHGGRYISPNIAAQKGYKQTEAGDFLLTTRDLTQAANFLGLISPVPTGQRFVVNQGANIIRLLPQVDGRFIAYWSNAPVYRAHIRGHCVGSTQIHLRKDDFLDAPLLLPCPREQHAIAEVLGSLDDKIDSNAHTVQTGLDLADALDARWRLDVAGSPQET
jgi:type I restriction enzyme S subunit